MATGSKTWVLTGSLDNFRATREHDFRLIGAKEGRRGNPWRFETEPEIVLEEDEFVPAEELAGELEHVRKWPLEHWQLAFQGQLRTVTEADAELLEARIRSAQGSRATA